MSQSCYAISYSASAVVYMSAGSTIEIADILVVMDVHGDANVELRNNLLLPCSIRSSSNNNTS